MIVQMQLKLTSLTNVAILFILFLVPLAFSKADYLRTLTVDLALEEVVGPVKRIEFKATSEASDNSQLIISEFNKDGNLIYQLDEQNVDGRKFTYQDTITHNDDQSRLIKSKEPDGSIVVKKMTVEGGKRNGQKVIEETRIISYKVDEQAILEERTHTLDALASTLSSTSRYSIIKSDSSKELSHQRVVQMGISRNGSDASMKVESIVNLPSDKRMVHHAYDFLVMEHDVYGNWLKRQVTVRSNIGDSTKIVKMMHERVISYY